MKIEDKIKNWFEEDRKGLVTDRTRKNESLDLLRREIEAKRAVPKASDLEIVRTQIRFMNKKIVLLQLLFFIAFIWIYEKFGRTMGDTELYLLGTVSTALISVFMVFSCAEDEKNHMAELAGTCYFNHKQMCVLRMTLCGGFNLIILSVVILYTRTLTADSLFQVGVYVLVPYLFAGSIHFLVMLTGRGQNGVISVGISSAMVILCGSAIAAFPKIYEKTAIGIWLAALVLFGVVYVTEIVGVLRQMDRGERLCMN